MSEAHAKLHLRDEVSAMDIDVAIELLLDSFIQSQKHSVGRQMIKKFEKYKQRSMDTSFLLLHIL
jgi:DNA replication licensing factor MCM2